MLYPHINASIRTTLDWKLEFPVARGGHIAADRINFVHERLLLYPKRTQFKREILSWSIDLESCRWLLIYFHVPRICNENIFKLKQKKQLFDVLKCRNLVSWMSIHFFLSLHFVHNKLLQCINSIDFVYLVFFEIKSITCLWDTVFFFVDHQVLYRKQIVLSFLTIANETKPRFENKFGDK